MGKCNGYNENTSSSFKRKLSGWNKLAYISKMNDMSFVPSSKKPKQKTTNEDYFFGGKRGGIPKKFKNAYINDKGKWVYGCKCGNEKDCESMDDPASCMVMNPFTNCKCAFGQYYDVTEKKCKQVEKGCSDVNDFNKTGKGNFYNFYHPLCNFKHRSAYASSDSETENNCCLSCEHKLNLIKPGERTKPYNEYFPAYSDNAGSDVEGEDLLKKDKEINGFNSRPKYFYPLFNNDGGSDGSEKGTSKTISERGILTSDQGAGDGSSAPGLGTCEGSVQCGSSGDEEFTKGYGIIKNNLFHCVRTSRKNMYTPGGHNWGKHPYWGANGTASETGELKKSEDFGWEGEGRGWAPKDEIDKVYDKDGKYTDPANNSNNQICSHTERIEEESSEFNDEEAHAFSIEDDCNNSRFKFRGKDYACGGHHWSCKGGSRWVHGCASCSSVQGQEVPNTTGFDGIPVSYLKR